MKRYNITVPKKYNDKQGQERTQWNTVGSLIYFEANGEKSEGFKLELPIFGNTQFYVFEQKPKTASNGGQNYETTNTPQSNPNGQPEAISGSTGDSTDEPINPEDIPF
jgi:single-stranded DNA-binding protein